MPCSYSDWLACLGVVFGRRRQPSSWGRKVSVYRLLQTKLLVFLFPVRFINSNFSNRTLKENKSGSNVCTRLQNTGVAAQLTGLIIYTTCFKIITTLLVSIYSYRAYQSLWHGNKWKHMTTLHQRPRKNLLGNVEENITHCLIEHQQCAGIAQIVRNVLLRMRRDF